MDEFRIKKTLNDEEKKFVEEVENFINYDISRWVKIYLEDKVEMKWIKSLLLKHKDKEIVKAMLSILNDEIPEKRISILLNDKNVIRLIKMDYDWRCGYYTQIISSLLKLPKLTNKQIKNYLTYSKDQLWEIIYGYESELTEDQIKTYADKKIDHLDMRKTRKILEANLTEEQFNLINKDKFSLYQCEQIILGFEEGLTINEVKTYAKKNLDGDEMKERRLNFKLKKKWGL